MAVSILAREVSDLCLGKPALRCLSVSATVADALSALKRLGESYLSVWSCCHNASSRTKSAAGSDDCRCVGKVCMVDIICFLCTPENLGSPAAALQSSVSVLIPKTSAGNVRHLDPHSSLVEAIDLILEGAQNLVIPIPRQSRSTNSRKKLLNKAASFNSTLHNTREYCWLTQEDLIRYLLNSIAVFSPTPINPINTLNVIDAENILAVQYDDPALPALPLISQSLVNQTSVAIVDVDGKLIGEISPFTLNSCDESFAAAIATLSAGDLMAYIDCGGPPEDLVQLVKDRLEERNLGAALELMDEESTITSLSSSSMCSSSSDEEFGSGKSGRLGGYSARLVRRSEAIVCYPWSSLVAVMIQALAHRVSYVWVVEEDGSLAGIVTYAGMLKVFRERLNSL
ncbi:hypothetical protein FH972_000419 [Carpinus fangiana]|uniref:CBS domain-containing protein n=1 Tax=Carpinus fangiana TaxID=176857 RepID=A0A5N6Q917_9ROSI|nr:hypothetical protein FH972_000419 [Carpinus fangiana]